MNATVRTSIDDLLTNLRHGLAQPGQSLLPLLSAMGRFSKYSLANQMLIFAQCPTATRVCGYRAWLKAGYQVRKGEKGIAIYAPMIFKDNRDADTDASHSKPRVGYRVAYVFDVSQVDRLAGTDVIEPSATLIVATDVSATRPLEQLKAFLVGHNVELEYRPLQSGLFGYTDGRRITCALGQAPHVEFATLAHETTHVLLHFNCATGTRPDLTTRETEAEAVAYLLCAQLGLDGTAASVEYIQAYRGTAETLDESLERIRATAHHLSGEMAVITFTEAVV